MKTVIYSSLLYACVFEDGAGGEDDGGREEDQDVVDERQSADRRVGRPGVVDRRTRTLPRPSQCQSPGDRLETASPK